MNGKLLKQLVKQICDDTKVMVNIGSSPWFKEVVYCDLNGRKLLEIIERIQDANAEYSKGWDDLRKLLEEE